MPLPTTYNYYSHASGIGSVGQYQMSGRPFMTGSNITGSGTNNGEVCITFPTVTKALTIINRSTGSCIYVHFDSRANADIIKNHHYMSLPNMDDSYGFDIRCTRVYTSMSSSAENGTFELHAELTGIDATDMHALTGSGINSL
jgi:hypothetical protein